MTEYQKLKHLREVLKLSQETFAISIGLKQSVYSKIERGQSQLSNESAGNIIMVYKINPNWWFFDEEPIFQADKGSEDSVWKEKYIQVIEENASLYKKLATNYELKAAEEAKQYKATSRIIQEKEKHIEGLKNN